MTKALYIASTSAYSGKSLATLAIALHLRDQGKAVGYFKPLGSLPIQVGDQVSDEDAVYIAEQIGAHDAPADLCPVLINGDMTAQACAGHLEPLDKKILTAFQRIAKKKDVVIIGGLGGLSRGALLGLSAGSIANLLDAKVLLMVRYEDDYSMEEALAASTALGERLLGVVFNCAGEETHDRLEQVISPCFEAKGIAVFGTVPEDTAFRAISLRDLAQGLNAKVLCGEKGLDELARHFLVGAMGPQSAAKYLQRVEEKVVVTGGDRPDIQLAALQTSTRGIVLTGGLHPSEVILNRARELGIPMLLVGADTFSVVEEVERLRGRMRVRGDIKIAKARELFAGMSICRDFVIL